MILCRVWFAIALVCVACQTPRTGPPDEVPPHQSRAELIEKLKPHFTVKDQNRILIETARKKGEWI